MSKSDHICITSLDSYIQYIQYKPCRVPKKILLVTEPNEGLTVITNIVEPTLFLSKMAVWVSYFQPDTSEEPAEIWSTKFSKHTPLKGKNWTYQKVLYQNPRKLT